MLAVNEQVATSSLTTGDISWNGSTKTALEENNVPVGLPAPNSIVCTQQ
jgi:hypothetical protein